MYLCEICEEDAPYGRISRKYLYTILLYGNPLSHKAGRTAFGEITSYLWDIDLSVIWDLKPFILSGN